MVAASHVVRPNLAAGSSGLAIVATVLAAFHLVSTTALVVVMIEVGGGQSDERQMSELMRALATSICGSPVGISFH